MWLDEQRVLRSNERVSLSSRLLADRQDVRVLVAEPSNRVARAVVSSLVQLS